MSLSLEFSETKHMSGDSVHLHHPLHYRAGLAWLGFCLKSLFDIGSFFPIAGDWLGLVRYHCVWHEVLYLRGPEGGLHGNMEQESLSSVAQR